jgi:hypothetical protein
MKPVAVVRRARFEGNAFEVVSSPSMKIIAQGYDTEEMAQGFADTFNLQSKGQTSK